MSNKSARAARRGLVKGPAAADRPEIAVVSQADEGAPHGQMILASGMPLNFVEEPWEFDDSTRRMAQRLHEFLLGEEPYLEFLSPHDGRLHWLTRIGASAVMVIDHARARGPVAPHATLGSKIVRVGGPLPRELLH